MRIHTTHTNTGTLLKEAAAALQSPCCTTAAAQESKKIGARTALSKKNPRLLEAKHEQDYTSGAGGHRLDAS